MKKTILWAGVCAAFVAGCTHDARQEYSDAGNSVAAAADHTGQAIKTDATDSSKVLSKDAKEAERSIRRETARAQVISKNDATSARVKTALMDAANLPTAKLRIDTNGHVVTLSGTVPTAGQKHRAALIAKQELGPGYDVENHLSVSGS